jgi:molybdopterin-guanine dinucleotide biosynthesis protein A
VRAGGVVLAGGRSSRMGAAKAGLEWHGSTLVRRVAGILGRTVDGPVIVVRAAGQPLPSLPAGVEVVDDGRPDRGPLEGLAAGLAGLAGRAEAAFVTATDAPLLHPAFVAAVLGGLGPGDEICVPVVGGVAHPLAAAYRTGVAAAVADLLAADRLRVGLLLERCRVRRLEPADLLADPGVAAGDPGLQSVVNLNGPDAYAAARSGRPPAIHVLFRSRLGGAGRAGGEAGVVRAATLGRAAGAVGVDRDGGVAAWLNGAPVGWDGELPLVEGDTVAFERAEGEPAGA